MDVDSFVREHALDLLRLGYVITSSREDAEDFAQDSLVAIVRKWRKVGAADHPWAYAKRLALNGHLDKVRRREVKTQPFGDGLSDLVDESLTPALSHDLDSALLDLSERHRLVLVLRYYEDMTAREIGAILGVSESSARSATSRALEALRRSYMYPTKKGS